MGHGDSSSFLSKSGRMHDTHLDDTKSYTAFVPLTLYVPFAEWWCKKANLHIAVFISSSFSSDDNVNRYIVFRFGGFRLFSKSNTKKTSSLVRMAT